MRRMRVPRVFIDRSGFRRSLAIVVIGPGGHGARLYRHHRSVGPGHVDAVVASAVTAAPVVGFVAAPTLTGLVFGLSDFVDERVRTPWQGILHAFDDHRIRVVEVRGVLRFGSADVHAAALGLRRRAAVLRSLRATERHDDPDAGRCGPRPGRAACSARASIARRCASRHGPSATCIVRGRRSAASSTSTIRHRP